MWANICAATFDFFPLIDKEQVEEYNPENSIYFLLDLSRKVFFAPQN